MNYACSVCGGDEFITLDRIAIKSDGKATERVESAMKCSNCGRRISVQEDGEIAVLQDSPGSLSASTLPQKVRSSVSADDRGVNSGVGRPHVGPLDATQKRF